MVRKQFGGFRIVRPTSKERRKAKRRRVEIGKSPNSLPISKRSREEREAATGHRSESLPSNLVPSQELFESYERSVGLSAPNQKFRDLVKKAIVSCVGIASAKPQQRGDVRRQLNRVSAAAEAIVKNVRELRIALALDDLATHRERLDITSFEAFQ